MNFYKHHIGDYDADTAHLSWVEDMAYTRLLRLYYRRERPVPADVGEACRLVRASTKDQRQAVVDVLQEFFVLADDGWHQGRADTELARYLKKVEHNRSVGKLGGRPRKTETQQKPTGLSLGSETEPKQNPPQSPVPRQIPSEAIASGADAPPPAIAEPVPQDPKDVVYALGVPLLTSASVKESNARSFLAMQCKTHGAPAVADALQRCADEKPVQPIPWLTSALKPKASGRHSGFAQKDYRQGVESDGSLV